MICQSLGLLTGYSLITEALIGLKSWLEGYPEGGQRMTGIATGILICFELFSIAAASSLVCSYELGDYQGNYQGSPCC